MGIDNLINLTLESCRFSKGAYSFEFDGMKNNQHHNYDVSTNAYISFSEKKLDQFDVLSKNIWPILETNLVEMKHDDAGQWIKFLFDNGKEFVIWKSEDFSELLIVTNKTNGEWFTLP